MARLTIKNTDALLHMDFGDKHNKWACININSAEDQYLFEFRHERTGDREFIQVYRNHVHYRYGKYWYQINNRPQYVSADWFTKKNAVNIFSEILIHIIYGMNIQTKWCMNPYSKKF